jgi:hypothetical protein
MSETYKSDIDELYGRMINLINEAHSRGYYFSFDVVSPEEQEFRKGDTVILYTDDETFGVTLGLLDE